MFESYRSSGKFSPTFLVTGWLVTMAGLAVAIPYQAALNYIPFIYLNLAVVVGLGALLMIGMAKAVEFGHCRNPILAVVAAIQMAILVVAATHFVSLQLLFFEVSREVGITAAEMDQLRAELTMTEFIGWQVEAGWLIGSSETPLSGIFVWMIWGIEALTLIAFAGFGAWKAAKEPYCEPCSDWTAEATASLIVAYPSPEMVQRIKAAMSFEDLLEFDVDPATWGTESWSMNAQNARIAPIPTF